MKTREQSMQFWNSLGDSFFEKIQWKQELTDKYFSKRNFGTLTGSEIEEIWRKETKTEENIYLNRLKEQYKKYKELKSWSEESRYELQVYSNIKCFCLDTQLVSFNDIEAMESEVNSSF